MTPEEFARRMQAIKDAYGGDPENCHYKMDNLMVETLFSLGYSIGIGIYQNSEKWYA